MSAEPASQLSPERQSSSTVGVSANSHPVLQTPSPDH